MQYSLPVPDVQLYIIFSLAATLLSIFGAVVFHLTNNNESMTNLMRWGVTGTLVLLGLAALVSWALLIVIVGWRWIFEDTAGTKMLLGVHLTSLTFVGASFFLLLLLQSGYRTSRLRGC